MHSPSGGTSPMRRSGTLSRSGMVRIGTSPSSKSKSLPLAVERARRRHHARLAKEGKRGGGVEDEVISMLGDGTPRSMASFGQSESGKSDSFEVPVKEAMRRRAAGLLTTLRMRFVGRTGALRENFTSADSDRVGSLDVTQLHALLGTCGCLTTTEECAAVSALVDTDHDGRVAYEELISGLFPAGASAQVSDARLPRPLQTRFLEAKEEEEATDISLARNAGVLVGTAGYRSCRPQTLDDVAMRGQAACSVFDIATGVGSEAPELRLASIARDAMAEAGAPSSKDEVCVLVGELGWHGNGGGEIGISPKGVGGNARRVSRVPVLSRMRAKEAHRMSLLGKDRLQNVGGRTSPSSSSSSPLAPSPIRTGTRPFSFTPSPSPLSRSGGDKPTRATSFSTIDTLARAKKREAHIKKSSMRASSSLLHSEEPIRVNRGLADPVTRARAMATTDLISPSHPPPTNTHSLPPHAKPHQTMHSLLFSTSPGELEAQHKERETRKHRAIRASRALAEYESRVHSRVAAEQAAEEELIRRRVAARRKLRDWYDEVTAPRPPRVAYPEW